MKFKTKAFLSMAIFFFFLFSFGEVKIQEKPEWTGKIKYKEGVKVVKNLNKPVYGDLTFDLEVNLDISDRKSKKFKFHDIGLITLDNQENIYALDTSENCILKFDSSGNYLKKIGRKGQGPGEFERPSNLFIDNQHNLYVSDQRKIKIFDSSGKYVKSIRLNYEIYEFFVDSQTNIKESPQSISRKEKGFIIQRIEAHISRRGRKFPRELIEAACQFPPHRPFFNRILVDDKKRIYVRRVDSILEKSEVIRFDIFGEDGYYLYKTNLTFTPEVIRNGYIYDIYYSEESNEISIKKYKIINWSNIKSFHNKNY